MWVSDPLVELIDHLITVRSPLQTSLAIQFRRMQAAQRSFLLSTDREFSIEIDMRSGSGRYSANSIKENLHSLGSHLPVKPDSATRSSWTEDREPRSEFPFLNGPRFELCRTLQFFHRRKCRDLLFVDYETIVAEGQSPLRLSSAKLIVYERRLAN